MAHPTSLLVKRLNLLRTPEGEYVCQAVIWGTPQQGPSLALRLQSALSDYFDGLPADLVGFPLDLDGFSDFRKQVMRVVQAIAPGQTLTYGQVAKAAGRPGAARVVGQAMARNPYPLLVPCHRVVPARGGLGNYGCGGPEVKARLLELERTGKPLTVSLDLAIEGPGWGCVDGEHH